MDLLGDDPALKLNDENWRIFFRSTASAPQHIGADAVVENAVITEGCEIHGTVRNSVIGSGVCVEAGALVEDSVIMSNTTVKSGAKVIYSMLDTRVTIGENAVVGATKAEAKGIAVVGADVVIAANATVEDGAMISE